MKRINKVIKNIIRFSFVLAVLISAFGFAMVQGGKVSWTIFYAIIPFLLYSILLFFYPLSNLTVNREIKTVNLQSGDTLSVVLTIKQKLHFPLLYIVISERWQDEASLKFKAGEYKKLFIVGFRKEVVWHYELEGICRGQHELEGVDIELSDFFGWMRKTEFIPIKNTVIVYPKMVDVEYMPIGAQYGRSTASSSFNNIKDTSMVTGIRDYEAGDRMSWIHWKSFARTGKLMTKEFEDRKTQDMFLIFDSRPSEVFEEQVELAASIMKMATDHQVGVGFLSTGAIGTAHTAFPFVQLEEQFYRVLAHLASIKPIGDDTDAISGNDRNEFQQNGTVILMTGSPDLLFLQSIVENLVGASTIICFAVAKDESAMRKEFVEDIQFAAMQGIRVQVVERKRFSRAFKEVARS